MPPKQTSTVPSLPEYRSMDLCCATAAASRAISSPFPRHRPSYNTLRSPPSFPSFALPRDLQFNTNLSSRSIRGIRVPRSMTPDEDSSYSSVVEVKDDERTVDDEEGVVEDKSRGSSVIEYSEDHVAGELSDTMNFFSKLDLKDDDFLKNSLGTKTYKGTSSMTMEEKSPTSVMEKRHTSLDTQEVVMGGETSSVFAVEQRTAAGDGHNSSLKMEERHTSSLILVDKLEQESETSSWIMEEQKDNSQVIMQEEKLPEDESSTSSGIMGMERLVKEIPNLSVTIEEKRCTLSGITEVERTTEDGLNVWDENDKGSPVIECELLPASEHNEEMNFLNKPTLKLEAEETYSILAYGVGAFLTLWLSSAVVGALDSLPVLPKLMEIIGLGFTIWFSYRYLIFKRNRDELFGKIEHLKEQILGPSE